MKFLLSAREAKENLSDFVVVDASFRLADKAEGAKAFADGHIPGALHVDLDPDLSGMKTGRNGRHPLPVRSALVSLFSRLGIGADQPVLCYDDTDHSGAGRLWTLLRWMGHENAFVLNGGLNAWKGAGYPVETGPAREAKVARFPEREPLVSLVSRAELQGSDLWDARAPERYRGEVEPMDAKAGHIPGARNLFYKSLLGADGLFLPEAELRARLPAGEPVYYCGSGVTATVLLMASESLNLPASLYAGSWSEWSSDPAAPVRVGEQP